MIQNTFEELKLSGNLPSPAGVGMKILQLTRTEDYSADEMGHAIMSDSSLTGRILKLANSADKGGMEPATTVSEAIMRLGSRTVRDLALAFSLVSERSAGTCKAFDYEHYWSCSLARAVAAQTLARIRGVGRPEEAYICGLLGEIGMLALASVYAETYAELLVANADRAPEALLAHEHRAFDINHSQVAACMMEDWGLPEGFTEAVAAFTSTRDLGGAAELDTLTGVLRCAQVLAEAMSARPDLRDRTWDRMAGEMEGLRQALGLDEIALQRLFDTCVSEWVAWGESLEVATGEGHRYADLKAHFAEARGRLARGEADPGAAHDPAPPVVPSGEPGDAGRAPALLTTPDGGRIRILAVDDDRVSLKVLSKHLERSGFEVVTARGGKDGLRAALKHTPDIVIADLEMPDMDGIELCSSLRRTGPGSDMYFLLLTGNEEERSLVAAFEAGADDYIQKPFLPKVLNARIMGGVRIATLKRKIDADKQVMMKQVAELGVLTRKLRTASLTDALTELPNRRYAMKRMATEWSSCRRTGRHMSLVMLDIDRFKSVNDDHGHDVGDAVLRETARVIQENIRVSDEACRVGGEEFLIIARGTSETDCMVVAERVRAAVEAHVVKVPGFDRAVTISMGVAGSDDDTPSVEALLKQADEAAYRSKQNGRNRVTRANDPQDHLRHCA